MYNKVTIMGRISSNIEIRQTQSGKALCRFNIAVDSQFKNQNGEYETDFFTVKAWNKNSEFVSKYFSKGQRILLDGALKNNHYTDKNNVKHYDVEILLQKPFFVEKKSDTSNQNPNQANNQPANIPVNEPVLGDIPEEFLDEFLSDNDGDIPF